MRVLAWEIPENICLQDVLWWRPPIRSVHIPEGHLTRSAGQQTAPMAFALVSEVMGPNAQVATGAREPGVMYTPALQSYSEARDQAVAASRLLLSRKSASMLKPLKTGTDLLR
jgi:hypothetical protein